MSFVVSLLLLFFVHDQYSYALCTRGPGPTITALNQTCVRFTGANTLDYCAPAGPTGATGGIGPQGETGPPPTVVQVNASCITVGGVLQCGYAGPVGPEGPAGELGPPPTVTPVNASCTAISGTGSSTICAPKGETGSTPGTTLVDGAAYALTREGVQAAIDAVTLLPIGGVVLVTGDITSDGVASIQIKSKVILDFGGHTVKAPADATSIEVITIASATASAKSLVADSLRGSDTVNVSTEDAATFSVGDMVMITNGHSPCGSGAPFLDNMANEIVGIDLTTGVLSLRSPLGGNHLVSNLAAVVRHVPIVDAGLRNVIMDANGNTGETTRLIHTLGCRRCKFSNIKLIGTHTPNAALLTGSCCGLMFQTGLDSTFSEIGSESYSGGTACRDISFTEQTAALISDVRSYNTGGFAPNVQRLHNSVFKGLISQHAQARGFRIDISSDNDFYGLNSANHKGTAGTGLFIAFGSHHNKIHGLTINNVGAGGLTIGEVYDCYNIVYGLQVARCKSYQVLLGSGTIGNVIYGNIGDALDTLRVQDGGTGNIICSTNTDSGNMACTQPTGVPTAGTFPANNMLSTSRIDNNNVAINMRGSDGTVRYISIPISATGGYLAPPRTTVVDGGAYALTPAGVQAAIDARSAAGGGTVSLAGDITVSGAAIQMRAKTTLDCNGYSIKAHATDAVFADGMVRNIGPSVAGNFNLLVNATRGTRNITLSPADSLNFVPGDSMNLQNCRMPGYPQTIVGYHSFHVYEVDYVTGVVTLRNPLVFDCFADGIAGSLALAARIRPIADVTVRNCVFDANGNTAGGFSMFTARFGLRYKAENIRFIARVPSAVTPFYSLESIDATFRDFYAVDMRLLSSARDFSFQYCENCLIENIHTAAGTGFGPNIVGCHDTTVQNVWSNSHEIRNFRVDSSYRNILRNVFVGGGWGGSSGSGIIIAFGSAHNIVDGVVAVGNHGIGVSFSQVGDDNNQVTGILAYANDGTDVGIVSPVTGNYISGNFEWTDGTGADLPGQNTINRVCGNRGLTAYTPRGPPFAATTDLRPYELTVTRANNTHLIESYRGSDGNIRVFVKEFI